MPTDPVESILGMLIYKLSDTGCFLDDICIYKYNVTFLSHNLIDIFKAPKCFIGMQLCGIRMRGGDILIQSTELLMCLGLNETVDSVFGTHRKSQLAWWIASLNIIPEGVRARKGISPSKFNEEPPNRSK